MTAPLRTGPWTKAELASVPRNGLKVFTTFHCGGGSSFGYKLAGYEVVGGVEIDEKMMALYRANHSPRHSYLEGVQDFKLRHDSELPAELFDVDVLDGSPPCSQFSMAGQRDKNWGREKAFREGQVAQRLDDLFFHFVDIAAKLRPKVVVAENVKGMLIGKARGYVKEIFAAYRAAGYDLQLFLLNAAHMGVPQVRERTFFLARRADLALPPIALAFDEPEISCERAFAGLVPHDRRPMTGKQVPLWEATPQGESFSYVHPTGSWFNQIKLHPKKPAGTLIANSGRYHWDEPRVLTDAEYMRLQSFPDDYDLLGERAQYVCGMSVPPFMMQRVADQIARQWFKA